MAPDRVLTNAHNLRDRTTQVTFSDGRSVQSEVGAVDLHGDLVVLHVETADAPVVEWSERNADAGDIIFSVTRHGLSPRIAFGMVSSVDRTFRGPGSRPITGAVEHTAPLARGASGGPLLDRDGKLVGINTHRRGGGSYLAVAADASLKARVDRLVAGQSVEPLSLGVAVAPPHVARRLRQSVGLDERDGVLVRGVEEGGAAARAGIREGDLLVGHGDQPLPSIDSLHAVLSTHDAAEPLVFRVVRGAEELELTVDFATADSSSDV